MSIVTVLSLATAVYSGGMAIVQTQTRRFFAHLFTSFSALVLVGLEVHTRVSVTGALALWYSILISAGGLTIVLRAVEARHGRLALNEYQGGLIPLLRVFPFATPFSDPELSGTGL